MTEADRINEPIEDRLDKYVGLVQTLNNLYWERNEFTFSEPPTVVIDGGRKYARVVKVDNLNGSRSVHSFVNMENGDILKGSWKAPIRTKKKGLAVRGNIYAADLGADRVNEHGPNYLRR